MHCEAVILGAGLAGLNAGLEMARRNVDFVILESAGEMGGLCRAGVCGPWRYDYGVKALYSQNAAVMDYLRALPVDYVEHRREVRVHHSGEGPDPGLDVDYPIENGIGQLPHEDKVACLLGYLEASIARQPCRNFLEWVTHRLGDGIARLFMLPYNRKIWDCPLSEISLGLVEGKIHPASVEEIVRSALGEKTVGRPYQARFLYPRTGMGALVDALALPIRNRVRLNFPVRRLAAGPEGCTLWSDRGDPIRCRLIVSTLPLPELGTLVEPEKGPRPRWNFNSTFFFIVMLDKAPAQVWHWHFFASPRFPFYRLTYMHNFSDAFPPCIVAEVTDHGEAVSAEAVVEGLERIGVRRSWIREVRVERLAYTYPIPTLKSDAEKQGVMEWFESRRVYPLGRNGSWSYLNVDGVFLQGWDRIPRILNRENLG